MSREQTIKVDFVQFIPRTLQSGVLYVSRKYRTATHLCCCGCGNKVVTPLKAGGWKLSTVRDEVTLYPSIGNWSFPCKSHYWIREGRIVWAPKWSQSQIDAARTRDQTARELYFDKKPRLSTFLKEALRRLLGRAKS
jgi:hypothetical protein